MEFGFTQRIVGNMLISVHSFLCCSRLPYDVTVEQALEYEAVRERIAQSIQALKSSTDMFLESIFKNVDKIP